MKKPAKRNPARATAKKRIGQRTRAARAGRVAKPAKRLAKPAKRARKPVVIDFHAHINVA